MFTKRVQHSWKVFSAAWTVFREIRVLWILKFLSVFLITVLAAGFFLPMYFSETFRPPEIRAAFRVHLFYYSMVMLVYFLFCFIILFFNAAIISAIIMHYCGMRPTLKNSIQGAIRRLPQLFCWSLLASMFGSLFRSITRVYRLHGRPYLGLAWSAVSWLAVPVLVVEGKYPNKALIQSGTLIRQTWGDKKSGNLMMFLPLVIFSIPAMILVYAGFYYGGHQVGVAACMLAGLYMILMASLHTLVHLIYQSVLYLYSARKIPPRGFSQKILNQAFSDWM